MNRVSTRFITSLRKKEIMIELNINGQPIDLDTRSRVQLSAHNPAFDDVLVARAYSFPFTIPCSDANLHALGHINRLDARISAISLPASVRVGGGTEWQGVVEFGTITDARVELVFKNKPRLRADDLNNTLLNTIMPVIEIEQVHLPFWKIILLPALGGQEHTVTINGEEYSVTSTGPGDMVTASNTLAALINIDYPGTASVDIATESIMIAPDAQTSLAFSITIDNSTIAIDEFETTGHARLRSFMSFVDNLLLLPSEKLLNSLRGSPVPTGTR